MEEQNLIQQLYLAYYGRPADPGGLASWSEQLESNDGNIDAIIDFFGDSDEFTQRYGDQEPTQLVNNLYQQLFGRNAEEGGLAFYTEKVESGELTLAQIASTISQNAANEDLTTVENRVEVANRFTQDVQEKGLRYGAEDIDAASQVVADVSADTNVAEYIQGNVQALLNSLPVAEAKPEPAPVPDQDSLPIELAKGNVVFSFEEESSMENGDAVVTISPSSFEDFIEAAEEVASSSAGNFGNVITLQTDDDTLELVTIEFSGASQLRDAARDVGYQDWIDLAVYNGDLVTADLLDMTQQAFFDDIDIESYFGYEWPTADDGQDGDTIFREDGEDFSLEIELLDSLGIANLDTFLQDGIA